MYGLHRYKTVIVDASPYFIWCATLMSRPSCVVASPSALLSSFLRLGDRTVRAIEVCTGSCLHATDCVVWIVEKRLQRRSIACLISFKALNQWINLKKKLACMRWTELGLRWWNVRAGGMDQRGLSMLKGKQRCRDASNHPNGYARMEFHDMFCRFALSDW